MFPHIIYYSLDKHTFFGGGAFGWKHRVTAHTCLRHTVIDSRSIEILGL